MMFTTFEQTGVGVGVGVTVGVAVGVPSVGVAVGVGVGKCAISCMYPSVISTVEGLSGPEYDPVSFPYQSMKGGPPYGTAFI